MNEYRSFKAHFLYWIAPAALVGLWMGLYFSGESALQQLVVPPWPGNREFGGLEYTQDVVLIVILVVLGYGVARAREGAERGVMLFFSAGALFIFLEEIDYGLHWIEYYQGIDRRERQEVRNLHNQGLTDFFKTLSDAILLFFFVILPWLVKEKSNAWLRYFTPSRMCTIAVVVMLLQSRLAHAMQDAGMGVIDGVEAQLSTNISEFRELFVYWVWMLYFHALVFLRRWPGGGSANRAQPAD